MELQILNQNGKLLVSSLDVANMTDVMHKHLLAKIDGFIKVLSAEPNFRPSDFFIESYYQDSTGRNLRSYLLTKKGCDMVANKMTGYKGVLFTATYVTKFEEMNQELALQNKPSYMIDDPVKRAEKWIEEQKEKQQLETRIKQELPYTNFGKLVSNSTAAINIGSFAKMLYDDHGIRIGRNKLFEWLRDKGYLIKSGRERNNPKQQYIEQGLFTLSPTIVSRTEGDIEQFTTLVTGKGQVKLSELLLKEYKGVAI